MSTTIKGHLQALITITIWSSTFIVSKLLLGQMTPLQILCSRFLIAIVFLSVIHPRFKKPAALAEELLFLAAGATLAGYFFFENSALRETYSSNVSLIVATIPLLTGLFAWLFYKKPFFSIKNMIGLLVAYLGVFLIITGSSRSMAVKPIGDLLAFGAALMFAIYSLLMPRIQSAYTMIQLTRKVFVYSLLVLVLLLLFSGQPLLPATLNGPGAASVLYLGIAASSLAFILWNRAIQAIGPVKTSQYIYLIPVLTTVISAIILKEPITWLTVGGTALILGGLYLSER